MTKSDKVCDQPIRLALLGFSEADRMIHWLRKYVGQCNEDWKIGSSRNIGYSEMYIYKENHRLLFLLEWSHVIVTD